VLFWPVTNASFENASYDEFEGGHFLTRPMMKLGAACARDQTSLALNR
jgi:hypothetical protein